MSESFFITLFYDIFSTFFRGGAGDHRKAYLFILTLKSHTKNQTDPDNFDGVMTSFDYDVASRKTDDVITHKGVKLGRTL